MARKNFRVTNGINIDSSTLPTTEVQETITSNSATTVDTIALNSFLSAEYTITLTQGSKIRTSKVIMQTDGTSVDMTEFGITETGGTMSGVVVSATTASTNAVLQVTVTDAASTLVRYKLIRNLSTTIQYVPDAPTIGTATAGIASATVTFTAPTDTGNSAITSYTATSNPEFRTGSAASSPITVSGLTGGTSYTFTVTATNSIGTSAESSASNSITALEPPVRAGYFGGGWNGSTRSAAVEKFLFSNDSRTTLASGLSESRYSVNGCANSGIAGYFAGGWTTSRSSTVDKFAFLGDVRTTLSSGLAMGGLVYGAGMANSGTAGYFGGGSLSSSTNLIDKLLFSNDSISTLVTTLSSARQDTAALANSGTAGYFSGGKSTNSSTPVTTIDKIAFSNDSRTTLASGLSSNRAQHEGVSNSGTAGYFGAGHTTSVPSSSQVGTIDKFDFSNDSRTTLAATLSSAINQGAFANSGTAGYFGGGFTGGSTYMSSVSKLNFSTESVSGTTSLSTAKEMVAGMANSANI